MQTSSVPEQGAVARAERNLQEGLGTLDGQQSQTHSSLALEYPMTHRARWGYGRPAHPELERTLASRHDDYSRVLTDLLALEDQIAGIPIKATGTPGEPHWHNAWFFGLDGASLYGMVATSKPARYIEVGSGHSTTFAVKAIRDLGLETEVTSIDPSPRADIEQLCNRSIRSELQTVDASVFDDLEPGDILFLDGTHVCAMNSDAVVGLLEIVPRLRPGVLVHLHDIFLPWDYRPDWTDRWYSEQYLLAAYLLGGEMLETILPNFYVYTQPTLAAILDPLWRRIGLSGYETAGHSFWARRSGAPV